MRASVRFCVMADNIYISSSLGDKSICLFDLNANKKDTCFWFGNLIDYPTDSERKLKNQRHLHIYKNKIIAIPDCQPLIELYDVNGNLLYVEKIDNLQIVKDVLEYVKEKNNGPNTYFKYFYDSYVCNNSVYILVLTKGHNNRPESNKIIQLEIYDDKIIPKQVFDLGSGWYGPLCISEGNILAFNSVTGELNMFEYE